MCASVNRTVFDIPFTWNRTRFEMTRVQCRLARKLVEASINVQFEKQLRSVCAQNVEIEENIIESNERLCKYDDKLRVLDNMVELASQSLISYFEKRMESVRTIVHEHCNVIQQIIREEAEHWKEIHAVMDQNLLNPGDIRSRNNYPRTVQKSPSSNIQAIVETDEDEHRSKLLNASTLTPLLTQMIRKSRLQSRSRLTVLPSPQTELEILIQKKTLIPNKQERFSIVEPLQIIDTTFVVKPEEADVNNEPDGSYRAPDVQRSHVPPPEPESSPMYSQPKLPARLYFSPTILQEDDALPENNNNNNEERLSPTVDAILSPIDQNVEKKIADIRRFGQTFLLDIVKTEVASVGENHDEYVRPTISDDDDVPIIIDIIPPSPLPQLPCSDVSNGNPPVPQESIIVQESSVIKRRTRAPAKTKSKPILVSSRKTRSATKDALDRLAKASPMEVSTVNHTQKRQTRKRKQSKSIDRDRETSEEENEKSSASTVNNKRKTRKRRQSKSVEILSIDENEKTADLGISKRKKKSADSEEKKRKAKQKKRTVAESDTKAKKRKPKKTDNDNEDEVLLRESSPVHAIDRSKHYSTRFSSKRDRRLIRPT